MTVFINDLTLHQLPLKVFISKRRDRFQSTLWPAHVKQIGLLEDNISSPEILHFTMCTSTQYYAKNALTQKLTLTWVKVKIN